MQERRNGVGMKETVIKMFRKTYFPSNAGTLLGCLFFLKKMFSDPLCVSISKNAKNKNKSKLIF